MPLTPAPLQDRRPSLLALRHRQQARQLADAWLHPLASLELSRTTHVMAGPPKSHAELADRVDGVISRDLNPHDRTIRANFDPDALGALDMMLRVRRPLGAPRVLVISSQPEYPAIEMTDLGCAVTAVYRSDREAATYRARFAVEGYDVATIVTDIYRPNVARLGGAWDAIIVDGTISQLPPVAGDDFAIHLFRDLAPLCPSGTFYVLDGGWQRTRPYRPLAFLSHGRVSAPTYSREPGDLQRIFDAVGLWPLLHRSTPGLNTAYRTHHYVTAPTGR